MELINPKTQKSETHTSDKRITEPILTHLNNQIKVELGASQIYYSMSQWCENQGYFGLAKLLDKHAEEERGHMTKVYDYISDRDELPITPDVIAPKKQTFANIKEVLKAAYDHEKYVSGTYNSLADLCMVEKDYMTLTFALDFLREQKEEEVKFKNMLDELNLLDNDKRSLYLFDQSIKEKLD